MSHTWVFEWKCLNLLRLKKARQMKSKPKSMFTISFDIKGIVHKEFALAGQWVSQVHILLSCFMATAWKCTKTSPRTLVTKNWTLNYENAPFFIINNLTIIPHPLYMPDWVLCNFSLFPWLKINLKGCHWHEWGDCGNHRWCWIPSHNMTSDMHLKNWRNAGNGACAWKGTTLRVMVANRSKVSFWPDGSTSPWNYENISLCTYKTMLALNLMYSLCSHCRIVDSSEQETASSMMAAFLGIGLASGSALSLVMVKVL
jgi:hypothetical protein